jgi:hypothetical protein
VPGIHDKYISYNNSSIAHRQQGKIKTPAPRAIAAGSGVIGIGKPKGLREEFFPEGLCFNLSFCSPDYFFFADSGSAFSIAPPAASQADMPPSNAPASLNPFC